MGFSVFGWFLLFSCGCLECFCFWVLLIFLFVFLLEKVLDDRNW